MRTRARVCERTRYAIQPIQAFFGCITMGAKWIVANIENSFNRVAYKFFAVSWLPFIPGLPCHFKGGEREN